jgi:hypothetical protein
VRDNSDSVADKRLAAARRGFRLIYPPRAGKIPRNDLGSGFISFLIRQTERRQSAVGDL